MGSPKQQRAGDEGSDPVMALESEHPESVELADLFASCHKSSPTVRKDGGSPDLAGKPWSCSERFATQGPKTLYLKPAV
jgi:hypothetical protein